MKSPGWDAEGHRHTIAVFVDALGAVAESDEAINTRAERFEARRRGEHGDRRERHHEPDHH